ncbi:MAG: metal-dependent transcriptional regulator [Spirochaetaceae bacterium]|jgi:DtxR family Mn-dependent transcriptional regulator|nr:metal-dependent transcriptional regulator [Spirochaetaceae bacterium]
MKMTASQEDYLEMVSFLSEQNESVRVTAIAAELGFSKPSVTAALKLLEEKSLIKHERYGDIQLTEKGRALAAEIRQKHEVLTAFLHEVLGVNKKTAEQDACKMEHVLSDETFTKLKKFVAKTGTS